jgi:hypothetical protein
MDDIRGVGPISIWPPGIGWWVVLAVLIAITVFAVRQFIHARSWKGDALRTLKNIIAAADTDDARLLAARFADILRRIAMARFSREQAAGLQGKEWLAWLRRNDPKGFDWEKYGKLLIDAPYNPHAKTISIAQIRALANAAKAWVK